MAKKTHKVEAFDGGINRRRDARDIEDNQLEEAVNIDISNQGMVTTPGDALSYWSGSNEEDDEFFITGDNQIDIIDSGERLTNGYGLFAFTHDYNMATIPLAKDAEFICINDGAHIDILDTFNNNTGGVEWIQKAIRLGNVHSHTNAGGITNFDKKVKPIYYKAGSGLRVCDGNFNESRPGVIMASGYDGDENYNNTRKMASADTQFLAGKKGDPSGGGMGNGVMSDDDIENGANYIRINAEIMKVESITDINPDFTNRIITVQRAQFGTLPIRHAVNSELYILNVPKVLEHIYRRNLLKSRAYTSATAYNLNAGYLINKWQQNTQSLDAPANSASMPALSVYSGNVTAASIYRGGVAGTLYGRDGYSMLQEPDIAEKVIMSIHEAKIDDVSIVDGSDSDTDMSYTDGSAINDNHTVQITAPSVDFPGKGYTIGQEVVISGSTHIDGMHEIAAHGSDSTKMKIFAQFPTGVATTVEENFTIKLASEMTSEDLLNKYIFGMSYLYPGGGAEFQESPITTGKVYSNLITHNESIFNSVSGWEYIYTIDGAVPGSATAVTQTKAADTWWQNADGQITFNQVSGGGGDDRFLRFVDSSGPIEAGASYRISIEVAKCSVYTLRVWPSGYNGTDGSIGDAVTEPYLNITAPGTHMFSIIAADSVDEESIAVLQALPGTDTNGTIRINSVQVFKDTPVEMDVNNSIDMRSFDGMPRMWSSFNMNTFTAGESSVYPSAYKWNERISGYKIYMKQIDTAANELSGEWLLAQEVFFESGEFINHTGDTARQPLFLTRDWAENGNQFHESNVTTARYDGASSYDGKSSKNSMRNIPLLTYQSENGFSPEISTSAFYKAATVVNGKTFIGNIKIGEIRYPDRMIEAPSQKYDTFPNDGLHYIDVVVSDGDEIVKLESLGDKIIQFKKRNAYLIQVLAEGIDLLQTWENMGILAPCQSVIAGDKLAWINNNGMYIYDGNEVKNLTYEKFSSDKWIVKEDEEKPIIIGYDSLSDKLIIDTPNVDGNKGFIYDFVTSSFVECQNLFKWFVSPEHNETAP